VDTAVELTSATLSDVEADGTGSRGSIAAHVPRSSQVQSFTPDDNDVEVGNDHQRSNNYSTSVSQVCSIAILRSLVSA
jgi:hypothetical protein